jgi:hypothetical protein
MSKRSDPGHSRPFTSTTSTTIPELREVEERGVKRIVLMQKRTTVRHYEAWDELVRGPDAPDGTMVFESVHHPAEDWGESRWEKA